MARGNGDAGSRSASKLASTVDLQRLRQTESLFFSETIREREDLVARQAELARFVSGDVIPRLLELQKKAARNAPASDARSTESVLDGHEIEKLADIILGHDLAAATIYITALRDRGLRLEDLYLDLLAPTARLLGELWESDERDFIDVTIGVARLQYLLSVFNKTHTAPEIGSKRHILIALAPGNQHSFGASMLEKFFDAAGWRVGTEYAGNREAIIAAVKEKWFALIGLSAASDGQLEDLEYTIDEVRSKSCNNRIGVMVGGPIFRDKPELCEKIGADATSSNAPTAVLNAQKIFDAALTSE